MFALSPEVTRTFEIEALQGELIRALDYDTQDFSQWPDTSSLTPTTQRHGTNHRRHASGHAAR